MIEVVLLWINTQKHEGHVALLPHLYPSQTCACALHLPAELNTFPVTCCSSLLYRKPLYSLHVNITRNLRLVVCRMPH
jgi:hypothetical protein